MSHRYYIPLRPLSLGTFPKPQGNEILHIENFEERQNVPEIARQAWGYGLFDAVGGDNTDDSVDGGAGDHRRSLRRIF